MNIAINKQQAHAAGGILAGYGMQHAHRVSAVWQRGAGPCHYVKGAGGAAGPGDVGSGDLDVQVASKHISCRAGCLLVQRVPVPVQVRRGVQKLGHVMCAAAIRASEPSSQPARCRRLSEQTTSHPSAPSTSWKVTVSLSTPSATDTLLGSTPEIGPVGGRVGTRGRRPSELR